MGHAQLGDQVRCTTCRAVVKYGSAHHQKCPCLECAVCHKFVPESDVFNHLQAKDHAALLQMAVAFQKRVVTVASAAASAAAQGL